MQEQGDSDDGDLIVTFLWQLHEAEFSINTKVTMITLDKLERWTDVKLEFDALSLSNFKGIR